jgi:hypothetical protein
VAWRRDAGQPHQNKSQRLKPEGKEPAEAQNPLSFNAYACSSPHNVNSFFDAGALRVPQLCSVESWCPWLQRLMAK